MDYIKINLSSDLYSLLGGEEKADTESEQLKQIKEEVADFKKEQQKLDDLENYVKRELGRNI